MKYTFKKSEPIAAGKTINLLEGLTDVKTNRLLLMFLGTGELGPPDGSQIGDLDNYGYQKFPTFETEFNILVPQAWKGYGPEVDPYIQDYILRTYGEDVEIVMIGHSLGARNVMEYTYSYQGIKPVKQVVGFIPIAGEMSWPLPTDWCIVPEKNIVCFAGDKDTAVGCVQSQKFVDAVNSCVTRKNKAVARIIPGKDHSSIMSYFFDPDRNAEGYRTIMSCFTAKTQEIPGRLVLINGKVLAKFDDGTVRELTTA